MAKLDKEKKKKKTAEEEKQADNVKVVENSETLDVETMAKPKEKKKKKRAEEEKRSDNVKVVQKSETLDVKIMAISESPDLKTSPIVGYFSSGYDPLKNSKGSNSGVKVYRSVNSRNPRNPRMQVSVEASRSQLNFVGTNYSGEATTPQLCNYALGVLDKETGILKMVPIAGNRIFRLEPRVVGMEQPENVHLDEDKGDIAEEKAEKLRDSSVYSTKKDINREKKRKALRQTEAPGMEDIMSSKLEAITFNKEAIEATESTDYSLNIPPHDLQATSSDTAYPLEKIIFQGEWNFLLDVFELTESGSELSPDVYPSFVCSRVNKCGAIKDESKRKRTACILSYITHLIKYKDRHSMDGVSSAKHHNLPSILAQKFSSLFGTTKHNTIPQDRLKLLISYILVLTLFVDDFLSDPTDIAKDLRMNPVALRPHYEYLGCKFVRENQVLLATLPVPLEFQTLKRKKRRR
ncbi:DNA-directed RNA polymerase I subunit rpa49 [Striga asiatica]|uniref:DNA-directed RNA polymerase I subunit rpa49 n=1 Tax=Striga asiatica TaxID=4170 RepID=A0A5A7R3X5_STRAF|nr:DNA-directed RNA polymerase I subunit rpa49 [Striga asiatica]